MKRKKINPKRGSRDKRQTRVSSPVRAKERVVTKRAKREADLDTLIERSPPAFGSLYIEEPKLLFGGNMTSVDPKTGLDQYGPFLSVKPDIRIGIIGTGAGIDAFRAYLEQAKNRISPGHNSRGKFYDSLLFPDD